MRAGLTGGLALLLALAGCAPDVAFELARGKALLSGAPGVAADPATALRHLHGAAKKHSPAAAFHLGLLYRRGAPGVPVDHSAALRWLRMAADAELPEAQFMLGQMLLAGEGTQPDVAQARKWFEKAAEHDLPHANLELAMAYGRGDLGVTPDQTTAERYLMEAQHALKHRVAPP